MLRGGGGFYRDFELTFNEVAINQLFIWGQFASPKDEKKKEVTHVPRSFIGHEEEKETLLDYQRNAAYGGFSYPYLKAPRQ